MNHNKRSLIGDALSFAYNAFLANIVSWIGIVLITAIASMTIVFSGVLAYTVLICGSLPQTLAIFAKCLGLFLHLSFTEYVCIAPIILLTILALQSIQLGLTRTAIDFYDTGLIKFRPVYSPSQLFASVIAQAIIMLAFMNILVVASAPLIVFISTALMLLITGLISFIVLGIISCRTIFTSYFIVDENLGSIEAISASLQLSKNQWNTIIGIMLIGRLTSYAYSMIRKSAVANSVIIDSSWQEVATKYASNIWLPLICLGVITLNPTINASVCLSRAC